MAKICLVCIAAVDAFVPVRVIAAIAPPTWSKVTPNLDAIGNTIPIDCASDDASALPSFTEATRISAARAALRFSLP